MRSMDKLDLLIDDRRRQLRQLQEREDRLVSEYDAIIADVRAEREKMKIELAAFELAATARPAANGNGSGNTEAVDADEQSESAPAQARRSGGRQIGSIDKSWRSTLRDMYANGNRALSAEEISVIAGRYNIPGSAKNMRSRMRKYCRIGLMEWEGESRAKVTPEAARRFNFAGAFSAPGTEPQPTV